MHSESVFEVGGASTGETVLVEVGGESKERRITGQRKSRPGGQVAQAPVPALPSGKWSASLSTSFLLSKTALEDLLPRPVPRGKSDAAGKDPRAVPRTQSAGWS